MSTGARSKMGGAARAVAWTAAGLAVALASPAQASLTPASCRDSIAKGFAKVVKTGLSNADKCRKLKDKAPGAATGSCSDLSSTDFDPPPGKYAASKTKAVATLDAKCTGLPVLSNYTGNDPGASVGAVADDTVSGNTLLVLGNSNLMADKAKVKCVETIAKEQAKISKEVLKNSTKCQGTKDKTASTFGAIDPSCVDPAAKSSAKAALDIPKACGTLTGADVGTCDPLPSCVIDTTVAANQDVARAIYQTATPLVPVCGDGIVQGSEQCDDGAANGTAGDPCNADCTWSTAATCGPGTAAGGTVIGHRIVKVALAVPAGKQLAGVQVGFDYPQQETSIAGSGTSAPVQNAVTLLQTAPGGALTLAKDSDTDFSFLIGSPTNFIDSGDLFQVQFDECVSASEPICNRSQNVTHCCPDTDIVACNAAPDDPVACFCEAVGVVNQADCVAAGCTSGVCANFPLAAAGTCDTGTLTCTTGRACTTATEATDCADWAAPVGSCNTSTKTCLGTSPNPGKPCTAANEALACSGSPVDQATCSADELCARLGDQTNGFYGCTTIFNPPGAAIGQFPATAVGPANASHFGFSYAGACPTGNTCVSQIQQTQVSCTVTDPVDQLAVPVDGVTCSITITEAP